MTPDQLTEKSRKWSADYGLYASAEAANSFILLALEHQEGNKQAVYKLKTDLMEVIRKELGIELVDPEKMRELWGER